MATRGSVWSRSGAALAPTSCGSPAAARGSSASTYRKRPSRSPGRTSLFTSERGAVIVADGGALPVRDSSQDVVYAHGVLQYAADPRRIVEEALRVLVPGGTAIFMVYNRVSWLHTLSKLMKVELEHEDAPGATAVLDP